MTPLRHSTAILIDKEGVIKEIIKNEEGLIEGLETGKIFYDCVIEANREKARLFIETLDKTSVEFNWEINMRSKSGVTTYKFAGTKLENEYLILSAGNNVELKSIINEMMSINNDQTNMLRQLSKEVSKSDKENKDESDLYDELSRLNNELVNIQRELQKKNHELSELNKLKNLFLGMAAHDLRNPLGIIISYSEFLSEEMEETLSEDHKEFLNIINRSSQFMLELIDNLLDVTAIESGNLKINFEEVNISNFIKDNIEKNQVLASKKKIKINYTDGVSGKELPIDASKITQVLNNLISNAIKYSYPESEILIETCIKDGYFEFRVKDKGKGIEEKNFDKIFRPFGKVSGSGTAGERSTGLGLTIVKNIVAGHGGRIWFESEIGKDSTFYFNIPVKREINPGE